MLVLTFKALQGKALLALRIMKSASEVATHSHFKTFDRVFGIVAPGLWNPFVISDNAFKTCLFRQAFGFVLSCCSYTILFSRKAF